MGESMNPKYSYSPLTTPFLYSLKPFWRVGISAAVTTRESLELFFNSVREKDNLDLLQNQTANLFRLAKHQGYMTTLLSAQNENLLSRCGLRFVDHFISSETMEAPPSRYTDEKLLEYVQKIQWNPLHLVVLHVRHAHSPYSEFFKGESQGDSRQDKTIDAYKKAMRYHDAWCKRLFQYLPQDVQVVFVSDHGEMMGEEGLYGHEFEHPLVHCIPVWTYPYKVLPASHFEIAQTLAKWMGVEVKNPNS